MRSNNLNTQGLDAIMKRGRMRLTYKSAAAASTIYVVSYRSVCVGWIVPTESLTMSQSKVLVEIW